MGLRYLRAALGWATTMGYMAGVTVTTRQPLLLPAYGEGARCPTPHNIRCPHCHCLQDRELRQMQTEHNRQIGAMQLELGRVGEMIVQNDGLRDQLRKALYSREQAHARLRAATVPSAQQQQQQQVGLSERVRRRGQGE